MTSVGHRIGFCCYWRVVDNLVVWHHLEITQTPTAAPSQTPTAVPSQTPTAAPSQTPTMTPSIDTPHPLYVPPSPPPPSPSPPTPNPVTAPIPTRLPVVPPTTAPTPVPTIQPTTQPTTTRPTTTRPTTTRPTTTRPTTNPTDISENIQSLPTNSPTKDLLLDVKLTTIEILSIVVLVSVCLLWNIFSEVL